MLQKVPESIGRALHAQRAGIDSVVHRRLLAGRDLPALRVHSTAFENMGQIPAKFTADGEGISPPLTWSGVPERASQVLVVVEDADAPTPSPLVHAIAVMQGTDGALGSGALPSEHHAGAGVATGLNSFLQHRWLPPDPPPGHGAHRYVFQVFALAQGEVLAESLGRHGVEDAIAARVLAAGWLVGTYERPQRQNAARLALESHDEVAEARSGTAGSLVS